jgi:hypothetical protein
MDFFDNSKDYNIKDIDIGVFSFNLGNLNNVSIDKSVLLNDFSKLFNLDNKNKIWIVSTQEDTSNSLFCKTLKQYFLSNNLQYISKTSKTTKTTKTSKTTLPSKPTHYNNSNKTNTLKLVSASTLKNDTTVKTGYKYHLLSHKSSGLSINLLINKIYFKIHLMIFIPIDIYNKNICKILYQKKIYHSKLTKSTLITTFQISLKKTDEPLIITAIASHFILDAKDKVNLGYDKRIKSLENILSVINKNIIHPLSIKYPNAVQSILWTGDLNFRLTELNNIKSDQLINYFKSTSKLPDITIPIKLQDFTNINKLGYTCKTTSIPDCKKLNKCKLEYLGETQPSNICYDINKTKKNKTKTRYPSYCDRIIGWSKGKYKIIPTNTNVVVNTDFDKYSDHNPIMGHFKYTTNLKYKTHKTHKT